MKKILMVCEAFGGGVFAYVSQLCNDMCNTFEIYLAYSIRPQTPKNYKDLLDKRIHLIEVKNFGHLKNPLADIKLIKELRQIEENIKPDVIHLHSSIAGGIGRIAFNGKNNTVVYTPHGYSFMLMGKDGSLKMQLYKLMEKILGKKNCITLTCCKSEDDVAKTLCKNTAFVETGVNIEDLSESLDGINPIKNEKFTVYTLGRICTQKQPELFNTIAELVPEARFVWIGGGELANKLKSPNIEITGWMPRKEALALAKGADIYILCSLGEAIAMSLLENMFMKKLCLASDVMGNKSVIKDGINGYLCNNAEDYARHIKDAIKSFPDKLPENAYKDIIDVYNTHEMTRKFVNFYNSICK